MFLSIDTSTPNAGVALSDKDQILISDTWHSTSSHTAELMPAISSILSQTNISLDNLNGICIASGPGGFSSLRVGMSVAKGIAIANKIPIASVGTLDLEAHPHLGNGSPVCAIIPSGRNDVAYALFNKNSERIVEDAITSPEELITTIDRPTLFCGEGLLAHSEIIKSLGDLMQMKHTLPSDRLSTLAKLGARRLNSGDSDNIDRLQPNYIKAPSIGRAKQNTKIIH
tara:strand:- start:1029 stop:1709 length:681 start_codon:yes stop_codon:yes gene_type:complete